jgi:hypothetical protein
MTKKTVQNTWMIGGAAALVLLCGASAARADERIVVKVPFAFIVADSLFPPGDYVVHDVSGDPNVMEIASADGRRSVFTMTIPSSSVNTPAEPELVFERVGERRFLAKIIDADGDERAILLTPSIEQRELLKVAAHGDSVAGSSR